MELELIITRFGPAIKIRWSFLGFKLHCNPVDAAIRVGSFLTEKDSLVSDDPHAQCMYVDYLGDEEPIGAVTTLLVEFFARN